MVMEVLPTWAYAAMVRGEFDLFEHPDLMDILYEYYLNSGDMPYGIAKARDGDPYTWIELALYEDLGFPI